MKDYLLIIFAGLIATSLYNFFACMLRALGNSAVPLYFLAVSAIINIVLDLLFIIGFHWGSVERRPPPSQRSTYPPSGSPSMYYAAAGM